MYYMRHRQAGAIRLIACVV